MRSAKSIVPECNVDSCLFNVLLGFEKEGVIHAKGNATVVKKIKERFDNLFCVGIVDKDRQDMPFLKNECTKVIVVGMENYFVLFKRENHPHYFIQMVPAIEQWIINVAVELEIDLNQTEVKTGSLNDLKRLSKQVASKNDPRFKSLFKTFVQKAELVGYEPLLKLQAIINYLLKNQYNADLKKFING